MLLMLIMAITMIMIMTTTLTLTAAMTTVMHDAGGDDNGDDSHGDQPNRVCNVKIHLGSSLCEHMRRGVDSAKVQPVLLLNLTLNPKLLNPKPLNPKQMTSERPKASGNPSKVLHPLQAADLANREWS